MQMFLLFYLHLIPLASALLLSQPLLWSSGAWASAEVQGLPRLSPGDSLSVERGGDVLISPSGNFSAGFYKVGDNAYCFAIWYSRTANRTVVWMATRGRPANGRASKLRLQNSGNLVLFSAGSETLWETDTSQSGATALELLDSGNLVLRGQGKSLVWQSFAFPTDTLLPGQPLTRNTSLVSNRAAGDYFPGSYEFKFSDDNVLYLIYNSPDVSTVYWPLQDSTVYDQGRINYNNTRLAVLDDEGFFSSSDRLNFRSSDYGRGPQRRLTLDHDGVIRLYSLVEPAGPWVLVWLPPTDTCKVHGVCGSYGICVYAPEPACACPPGFRRADLSDWSKGCSPEFNLSSSSREVDFLQLPHTDYYGYDLDTYATGMSLSACRNACQTEPRCRGFGYKEGTCYPKYILLNGYQRPTATGTMHIKIPTGLAAGNITLRPSSTLNCSNATLVLPSQRSSRGGDKNIYLRYLIGFVGAVGVVEAVMIGLGWWFIRRIHRNLAPTEMGYRLHMAAGFRRFTYAELKEATHNFSEEIGRGGFGPVYRGLLDDGKTAVAVKRLEGVTQGETEFWAEVSIIGRINHINLVRIWGFCAEDKHRLLVYEYLEKGSLDKFLFSDAPTGLDWEKRYAIALGTAMGLSYLHEECLEWVLHCDVKPQNILLDEHFGPKLADFGMSKFVEKGGGGGNSNGGNPKHEFSRARGTRGYMAPEWILNQEITAKADVYSYGVVLLELVTGRSASRNQGRERNHLVLWVKQKMEAEEEGFEGVADERLQGDYDKQQLELFLKVALLCVQNSKDERPSTSDVVGLLLGDKRQVGAGED